MKRFYFVLLLFILISGCAFNIPKGTLAKPSLSRQIADRIGVDQMKYAPNCKSKIIETRVINKHPNVIYEEWTVKACDEKMLYLIELYPSQKGILSFNIRRIK